jgi:hypothetical protein
MYLRLAGRQFLTRIESLRVLELPDASRPLIVTLAVSRLRVRLMYRLAARRPARESLSRAFVRTPAATVRRKVRKRNSLARPGTLIVPLTASTDASLSRTATARRSMSWVRL